jgi:hypothetical protein
MIGPVDPQPVPTQRVNFEKGKKLPFRMSVGDRIKISYSGKVTSLSEGEYGSDICVETGDVEVQPIGLMDAARAAESEFDTRGGIESPFTFNRSGAVRPMGSS